MAVRSSSRQPSSATRKRILDAAVDLFWTEGFGGAGLRDIADLATINVASIYHHFPSKQDLLVAIIEETYERCLEQGRQALAEADGPAQALVALTHHHVVFHCSHPREAGISDRELGSVTVNIRKRLVEVRDAYEQLWDAVLEEGIEQAIFATEDRELTRIATITMCSSVAVWYRPNGRLTVDQIARTYSRLVLRMLARRDRGEAPPHGSTNVR
jgi:AcrR family transcriptional regulator